MKSHALTFIALVASFGLSAQVSYSDGPGNGFKSQFSPNCKVSVVSDGPSGPILSTGTLNAIVAKQLAAKNYQVANAGEHSEYQLKVHYVGALNENPYAPTTMGASVRVVDLKTGKVVAEAEELPLNGVLPGRTNRGIAKTSVRRATAQVVKRLEACKNQTALGMK